MSTAPKDRGTREGYLLLADISGYTAFLTGTELEHAQAIIHELTTLIRDRLAPPMRFVKLEGDEPPGGGPVREIGSAWTPGLPRELV